MSATAISADATSYPGIDRPERNYRSGNSVRPRPTSAWEALIRARSVSSLMTVLQPGAARRAFGRGTERGRPTGAPCLAVRLADPVPAAVADGAGQVVVALLHRELPVHQASAGSSGEPTRRCHSSDRSWVAYRRPDGRRARLRSPARAVRATSVPSWYRCVTVRIDIAPATAGRARPGGTSGLQSSAFTLAAVDPVAAAAPGGLSWTQPAVLGAPSSLRRKSM